MNTFPFSDLHSFKDYVGFVALCAPDDFPPQEGDAEEWTLDMAFEGLRVGLDMAIAEKGPRPVFDECRRLFQQALVDYKDGRMREGFAGLDQAKKLLRRIRTQ